MARRGGRARVVRSGRVGAPRAGGQDRTDLVAPLMRPIFFLDEQPRSGRVRARRGEALGGAGTQPATEIHPTRGPGPNHPYSNPPLGAVPRAGSRAWSDRARGTTVPTHSSCGAATRRRSRPPRPPTRAAAALRRAGRDRPARSPSPVAQPGRPARSRPDLDLHLADTHLADAHLAGRHLVDRHIADRDLADRHFVDRRLADRHASRSLRRRSSADLAVAVRDTA